MYCRKAASLLLVAAAAHALVATHKQSIIMGKGKRKTSGTAPTAPKRQKKATPQQPGFVRTDGLAQSVFEDATGFRGDLKKDAPYVIGNVVRYWKAEKKLIIVKRERVDGLNAGIPTIIYEECVDGYSDEDYDWALIRAAEQ